MSFAGKAAMRGGAALPKAHCSWSFVVLPFLVADKYENIYGFRHN